MIRPGFFDFEYKFCKITKQDDPHTKIDAAVDWEISARLKKPETGIAVQCGAEGI